MNVRIIKSNIEQLVAPEKLPIFAYEIYLAGKSSDYGWFFSDDMVLPFYGTTRLGIRRIFFTTAVICIKDKHSIIDEKIFLESVVECAKRDKVDIIGEPLMSAIFNTYPEKSVAAEYGTYLIDLTLTEDELLKKMNNRFRSYLKKGESDGLTVRWDNNSFEDGYKLIALTYTRQNKPFIDRKEYDKIKNALGDYCRVFVVYNNNVAEGCIYMLWSPNQYAYYLYGGSIEEPHPGSLKLLHYKAMCEMKSLGVKIYDFVGARINPEKGSKYEGIQTFKHRMGSDLKTGYRWFYPISKVKFFIFNVALFLKVAAKGKLYKDTGILYEKKRLSRIQKNGQT